MVDLALAGKSTVERAKTDLIEERDNLVIVIGALNAEIYDLIAKASDYPHALDGIRTAAAPLASVLRTLARTDLRTAYADVFILAYCFGVEHLRDARAPLVTR